MGLKVEKTKLLGRAADFCPTCETVQPMRVFRVPRETAWGFVSECPACGFAFEYPQDRYRVLAPPHATDLTGLIPLTNPNVVRRFAWELDQGLTGGIGVGAFSRQMRERQVEGVLLVVDRMLTLSEVLPRRRTKWGPVVLGVLWSAVILQAFVWLLLLPEADKEKDWLRVTLTSPVLSGLVLGVSHMMWAEYRLWQDRILPSLRAGLRSKQVSHQEFDEAFARLATREVVLTKRLKRKDIADVLAAEPPMEAGMFERFEGDPPANAGLQSPRQHPGTYDLEDEDDFEHDEDDDDRTDDDPPDGPDPDDRGV